MTGGASSRPGTAWLTLFRVFLPALVLMTTMAAEPAAPAPTAPAKPAHHKPWSHGQLPESAKAYYKTLWGVEIIGVKPVSSGTLLRFSYKVVDPVRAKPLHDKKSEPFLYDQATRAKLVIPEMEKIGKLRQTPAPEAGREYWMLFSNKGNLVKPGSRVDVVIGTFRAQGLTVQPL